MAQHFVVKADNALGTGFASQEGAIAAAKELARIHPNAVYYVGSPAVKVWTPPAVVVAEMVEAEDANAQRAVAVELLKPKVVPKKG